jgi:hypothetical protein
MSEIAILGRGFEPYSLLFPLCNAQLMRTRNGGWMEMGDGTCLTGKQIPSKTEFSTVRNITLGPW